MQRTHIRLIGESPYTTPTRAGIALVEGQQPLKVLQLSHTVFAKTLRELSLQYPVYREYRVARELLYGVNTIRYSQELIMKYRTWGRSLTMLRLPYRVWKRQATELPYDYTVTATKEPSDKFMDKVGAS